MRTNINATLRFGSIFVPVGVATAAKRNEIAFRQLHSECGSPIKLHTHCDVCDKPLGTEDIVKGWEISKNVFLRISEADMKAVTVPRDRMIELTKFVPKHELTTNLIERSYFLQPNEALHRPYELLSKVLGVTQTVGLGSACLWGKEFPIAVEADEMGVLMLRYLFCVDEVRSGAEITALLKYDVDADEIAMAQMWIEQKVNGHLEPDDLINQSREKTLNYLEHMAAGTDAAVEKLKPVPQPTVNLMSELKEMIA